jgi:hypothetical protein
MTAADLLRLFITTNVASILLRARASDRLKADALKALFAVKRHPAARRDMIGTTVDKIMSHHVMRFDAKEIASRAARDGTAE